MSKYKITKIKNFFKKVKSFKLLDYFLTRKVLKLAEKYDINSELIDMYQDNIIGYEADINTAKMIIKELLLKNDKIKIEITNTNTIR